VGGRSKADDRIISSIFMLWLWLSVDDFGGWMVYSLIVWDMDEWNGWMDGFFVGQTGSIFRMDGDDDGTTFLSL
jgi:hypothetical protein